MSEELTFCGTPLPDFIRLYEEQAESRIMSPDEEEVFSLVKAANDLQSRQPDKELVEENRALKEQIRESQWMNCFVADTSNYKICFVAEQNKELVEALEKICSVSPADGYARCIEIADEALAKYKERP